MLQLLIYHQPILDQKKQRPKYIRHDDKGFSKIKSGNKEACKTE